MKNRRIAIMMCLLTAAFALTGCRHRTPAPEEERGVGYEVQEQTPPPFHYMSGTFTAEAEGVTVNGVLRACCDSMIWVSASKIVDLGRAVFTPDSVLVYAKVNNSYYRCDYPYFEQRFGVKIDFATLQQMMLDRSKKVGETLVVPVRTSQFSTDVKIRVKKVEYPLSTTFPFSVPGNAKRMTMSMFE